MNETKIEYLTHTWNPLAMRCTPISEGCANCWHLRIANRLSAMTHVFPDQVREAYAGDGPPILISHRVDEPIQHKRPAVIGTQFMGDLFHEDVSGWDNWEIFDAIERAKQHTFLILTKRARRMGEWFKNFYYYRDGPLPNMWLGVTVENQEAADYLIPKLLAIPAAVRWASVEPMLERIDLDLGYCLDCDRYIDEHHEYGALYHLEDQINWLVIGCETGPNRRPMKIEWALDLIEQCQEAGVPVYVKQLDIDGRVSHDPNEWPKELQIREMPDD